MNFNKIALGGTAALTLTAIGAMTAAPASAIAIGSSVSINGTGQFTQTSLDFFLRGQVAGQTPVNTDPAPFSVGNTTLDFNQLQTVSFGPLGDLPYGVIRDISNIAAVTPGNKVNDFLEFFPFNSSPAPENKFDFDVTSIVSRIVSSPGDDNLVFDLQGFFDDGTPGIGTITTQFITGASTPTTYSATFTAIPTPAMLPGLVAMGIAALRKRKAEAEAGNEA